MADARKVITDRIQRDNPTYATYTYPKGAPDGFTTSRPVQVSAYRSGLTNAPSSLTHALTVELITGATDEDELDGHLDAVLESLQRIPGLTWTEATRTVFENKWQGYQVAVTVLTPHVYREAIASEGDN